jgi:hypothetical protein
MAAAQRRSDVTTERVISMADYKTQAPSYEGWSEGNLDHIDWEAYAEPIRIPPDPPLYKANADTVGPSHQKIAASPEGASVSNPVSREEIDAKLEAVEARVETRFVDLTNKVERLTSSVEALNVTLTTTGNAVASESIATRKEVRDQNNLTRWTIIGLAVAALSLIVATQANLLSALQTGIGIRETFKPTVEQMVDPVVPTPTPLPPAQNSLKGQSSSPSQPTP